MKRSALLPHWSLGRSAAVAGSTLLLLALFTPGAVAHACYLADDDAHACTQLTPDAEPLVTAITNPLIAVLLVGSLLAPIAAGILWPRLEQLPSIRGAWSRLHDALASYEDLLPWMLRLSLGIALAAAGATGYILSPLAPAESVAATRIAGAFTLIGFLFLLGFLVRPAALVTLAIFAWALAGGAETPHFLFGIAELAGAALALLILGGGRPGLDDLIQRTLRVRGWAGVLLTARPGAVGRVAVAAPVVLRIALAVSLAYGAFTEKLLNPHVGMQVAREHGLTVLLPAEGWVLLVGTVELYLALLFLVGFETRAASVATFGVLTATLFYFGESLTSHVTLFGVASWLFVTGAGPWSLDHAFGAGRVRARSRLDGVPRSVAD